MDVLSVVGARPQFIKIAPFCRAIAAHNASGEEPISHFIVHTGQHYDDDMSSVFFQEMGIPAADRNLGVGSGSQAVQTAGMLVGLEKLLRESRPDTVVVFGDTNSTLAAALAAAKLCIPITHVEAGLRSFDRRMPEEINRIVADRLSELNLAPTKTAMENLANDGLADTSVLSGDVMLDAVHQHRILARKRDILSKYGLMPKSYAVATIHRADSTQPDRLPGLLAALNQVADSRLPIIFPIHPRTRAEIDKGAVEFHPSHRLNIVAPMGYLDMLQLVDNARLVLTDSGGLQKEAFFLDVPCITLRETTEWLETIEAESNSLVGSNGEAVLTAVDHWIERTEECDQDFAEQVTKHFGDARAAVRIVEELTRQFSN